MTRRHWAVVASLALILAATLTPGSRDRWVHDFWCWRCRENPDAVELAANILLFVPLGLSLSRGMRASRALATIVATTFVIELLQYFVIVGRFGVLRDVVSNTAGGMLGLAIGYNSQTLIRPDTRTARRIAWIAAAVWVTHAALSMAAFRPSATRFLYYAQVAPQLGQYDLYGGVVAHASVNGATVFSGPFPPGVDPDAWISEPLDLAASVTTAPPTSRPAPILGITDSRRNDIAFLVESRGDLAFRSRTRGVDFGWRAPFVVLGDVFSAPTSPRGNGMLVTGLRDGFTLKTGAQPVNGPLRTAQATLTPSQGWMLWWPFGIPRPATTTWVRWLWLAIPFAAIAFWSGAGGGSRGPSVVSMLMPSLVAIAGAHVLVPWLFGARPIGVWSDALAIGVGLVAGLALGASRRSASRT
ncbi:MAG TPA: VanZ family protein [Gemmatimonadaceae bacterium]